MPDSMRMTLDTHAKDAPRVPPTGRPRWMAIGMVLQAISLAMMLAEDLGLADVATRLGAIHADVRRLRDAA